MKKLRVMKVLLIMIIAFFSFSCNHSQRDNNQLKKEVFTMNNNGVDNNLVTGGVWHILSEERNNIVSKCNVCPKIEFFKKGTGKITKPSKEKIDFTYTLSLDSKKVEFVFKVDQSYFDGKEYFYKIHTEDNLEILGLSSKDGKSKYTLSREK